MKNQMQMLKQMQQMQDRLARVQADLENERVESSSGGGAVQAVVNGQQRLLEVRIDPDLGSDVDMLQDLVVAAVNEAMDQARELAAQRMQAVTAGLGLPPGLI